MTFTEAVSTCFAKAFVFSGRASRAEFWWFVLFCLLASLAIVSLAVIGLPSAMIELVFAVFQIAILAPSLAVGFRRLQDTGRNGWFSLLAVVGAAVASFGRLVEISEIDVAGRLLQVGIFMALLTWYVSAGTDGPNQYGPDPRRTSPRR